MKWTNEELRAAVTRFRNNVTAESPGDWQAINVLRDGIEELIEHRAGNGLLNRVANQGGLLGLAKLEGREELANEVSEYLRKERSVWQRAVEKVKEHEEG